MSVLYLSYNGLMEPLGQSQVLPYLRHLAEGRPITLITFEKPADLDDPARRAKFAGLARAARVRWIPLRYHKAPPGLAKIYDLSAGLLTAAMQCRTGDVRIVHARGYIMSALAMLLKQLFGVRFIFDTRGFYVHHKVELGHWAAESLAHRWARWLEGHMLRTADVVFALSPAAVEAMKAWPSIAGRPVHFEVVTTCTDLDLFQALPPRESAGDRRFTVGYAGNAGQGYLFDPVLDTFAAVRTLKPEARLKIVNRNDHAFIRERLRARQISEDAVELLTCDYDQMPRELSDMDMALFFYRWQDSHVSSVPTRMGELLACGVVCVSNVCGAGVVDILEGEEVGVVLRGFDEESIRKAAAAAVGVAARPGIRARCADAARRHFSLETGAATYERVYRQLEQLPA